MSHSWWSVNAPRIHGNAKTNNVRPAVAATYCLPFTAYVIGLFNICAPRFCSTGACRCAHRVPASVADLHGMKYLRPLPLMNGQPRAVKTEMIVGRPATGNRADAHHVETNGVGQRQILIGEFSQHANAAGLLLDADMQHVQRREIFDQREELQRALICVRIMITIIPAFVIIAIVAPASSTT